MESAQSFWACSHCTALSLFCFLSLIFRKSSASLRYFLLFCFVFFALSALSSFISLPFSPIFCSFLFISHFVSCYFFIFVSPHCVTYCSFQHPSLPLISLTFLRNLSSPSLFLIPFPSLSYFAKKKQNQIMRRGKVPGPLAFDGVNQQICMTLYVFMVSSQLSQITGKHIDTMSLRVTCSSAAVCRLLFNAHYWFSERVIKRCLLRSDRLPCGRKLFRSQ